MHWLAKSSRLDVSFEVSWLQQSRAQQYSYERVIPGIDLSRAVVIEISDASPGKMPRQGSQGGILMMSSPEVIEQSAPAACLFWLSHRLKQVARSSMAMESMGLCEATEHAEFLRACVCEMTDVEFDFRQRERSTLIVPLVAEVFSIISQQNVGCLVIESWLLTLLPCMLLLGQLWEGTEGRNASLRWLPGPCNLADGLTKHAAIQSLIISVPNRGPHSLADESTLFERAQSQKVKIKKECQWQ